MKKAVFLAAAILLCAAPSLAQNAKLKQTNFQDGTGSIGLAPGWEINGAYNGAVQCDGPNGSAIVMKMPWVIMLPGTSVGQLPGAAQQPMAAAGNIGAALREVLAKKVGATLKRAKGRRVNSAGGPPAYLVQYEYVQNGKSYTAIGYFATLDYGSGQPFWQMYSSAVIAPSAQFTKMLPAMLAMWKSWRPNGAKPVEGSSSQIFDRLLAEKKLSQEKIQQEFRESL